MDAPEPVARELVESHEFSEWVDGFSNPRLNEVLRSVEWALSTNAEAYPVVEGFKDIRTMKTDPIEFGLTMMPRLRLWFRISSDDQQVCLEHIEADPLDEEL